MGRREDRRNASLGRAPAGASERHHEVQVEVLFRGDYARVLRVDSEAVRGPDGGGEVPVRGIVSA